MSTVVNRIVAAAGLALLCAAPAFPDTNEVRLNGRNVIWSPVQDLLLYAATGKSSGSMIWRVFDPATGDENTLCYGRNIMPVWSFDGNYVAYQKGPDLVITDKDKNTDTFRTPGSGIDSIAWSPDSLKIIYAGDDKINLYDIASKKNAFVTFGRNPILCPKNEGLLYTDDNFILYYMDEKGERQVLMNGVDAYRFSPDLATLVIYASDPARFILYDWESNETNVLTLDAPALGFDADRNGVYLFYATQTGGVSAVHLLSGRTVKVLDEGEFPKLSFDGKWFSYELPKSGTVVMPYTSLGDRLPAVVLYRISLGSDKGVKAGDELEVYEEKVNPFNQTVTGYDRSILKGRFKVLSARAGYSLCEPQEGAANLEINDAVVIPSLGVYGFISGVVK
jgi:WD40 repeat protein